MALLSYRKANEQADRDLGVSEEWFFETDDERSVQYWMGWRDFLCDDIDPNDKEDFEDYLIGVTDAKDHYKNLTDEPKGDIVEP
jgi:hypothetical protein